MFLVDELIMIGRSKKGVKKINRRTGFTFVEVLVGLFITVLLFAGILKAIGQFSEAVQSQHEFARAAELADTHFKDLRSMAYTDMLTLLGMTSDQQGDSGTVTLETSADGFIVNAVADPDTDYGNMASESVLITIEIGWRRFQTGTDETRTYETIFLSGGIAQ